MRRGGSIRPLIGDVGPPNLTQLGKYSSSMGKAGTPLFLPPKDLCPSDLPGVDPAAFVNGVDQVVEGDYYLVEE